MSRRVTGIAGIVSLAAVAAFSVSAAQAQVLVYEGFNYGDTDGALIGKSGGGEIGLQGTWVDGGTNSTSNASNTYRASGLTFSEVTIQPNSR